MSNNYPVKFEAKRKFAYLTLKNGTIIKHPLKETSLTVNFHNAFKTPSFKDIGRNVK